MNKKGFTLIELLSTITIMGLIATITTANLMKFMDNKNSIEEQNINSVISEAACVYLELNENKDLKATCLQNGCTITTDTLIQSGLINAIDVDNPKVINIYEENHEKKCIVKED